MVRRTNRLIGIVNLMKIPGSALSSEAKGASLEG
jgi:hypothetical protein